MAEALALETAAAQAELAVRPALHKPLALPCRILKQLALAAAEPAPAQHVQVIRFDFHYTRKGWQISEANTDVPGGYTEASALTQLVREFYPSLSAAGNPARSLGETISRNMDKQGAVALVHSTAFTDDRQAMLCLARELRALGLTGQLLSPDHLTWDGGRAWIRTDWHSGPASFVFRFFPAEWLLNLKRATGWPHFFHGALTPLCNSGAALLTQSKRFPLVWGELNTALPTWRRLMPETQALHEVNWRTDEEWVLKPALGRVGEMIGLRGVTGARKWEEIYKSVQHHPEHWVAQRRFEAIPLETEDGPLYPCLGIYTINGRAAGAYGRLARVPLIDQYAQEAAVLLRLETEGRSQSILYGQN